MTKARHVFERRRRAALGVAGVALGSLVVTIATTGASDLVGANQALTLHAETADAGALIEGNDVRMFGVKVGVVSDLDVINNDTARLTLDLSSTETPIHTDATMRVRPVSLLGERYLDLNPGSATTPVASDGHTFPTAQTTRAVDLDEVLDSVDQPTGRALSILLTTLGEGMAGNGENVADTVSGLAPSMEQTEELVSVLDNQTATLRQLIDAFGPVVASLGINRGGTTDALIDSAGSLLDATAEEREALEATLEQLPSTLATARRTLSSLSGLADEATPALASARPFTNQLDQIADDVGAFTQAADPAISTLKPVLSQARELVRQASPLVAQLNSSSDAMVADAVNGSRFVTNLSDHLGGLLDFITYWSLTTNSEDALSHYFRVQLIANTDTVTSAIPSLPIGGSEGGSSGGLPELPGLPNLPPLPGLPDVLDSVPGLPDLLGVLQRRSLASSSEPDRQAMHAGPNSATGLTIAQEQELLTMLTGGAA